MTSQPDELVPESEPDRQDAVRHTAVALRSIGQPNSVAVEFDFWDGRYEGRRPFSELLGTFFLVLVAVAGGLVAVRIAYVLRRQDLEASVRILAHAIPAYQAQQVARLAGARTKAEDPTVR